MMKEQLLAEYFCNHQPFQVRSRLLEDRDFISSYGLRPNAVITIGGKIRVNQKDFLPAIRKALEKKGQIKFSDLDGKKHIVRLENGHIQVKSSSKELEARLDNFLILSPDRKERMKSLKQLIDNLGPMAPDLSNIIVEAEKGELNYDQIDLLLNEFSRGVVSAQNRLKKCI